MAYLQHDGQGNRLIKDSQTSGLMIYSPQGAAFKVEKRPGLCRQ